MKRTWVFAISLSLFLPFTLPSRPQFFNRLKQAAKDKAEQTVTAPIDNAPTSLPKPAPAPTAAPAPAPAPVPQAASAAAPANGTSASAAPTPIVAYQNYDFTPGKTIIFADDFTATQDGEFPDQWGLISGQGGREQTTGF